MKMIIQRIFIIDIREIIQQLKIHLTNWDHLNSHQILILPKKLEMQKDNLQSNLKKVQELGHLRYLETILLQNNLNQNQLISHHLCSCYLLRIIWTMQVWNLLLCLHKIFYLKRCNPNQNRFQQLWITAMRHTQNCVFLVAWKNVLWQCAGIRVVFSVVSNWLNVKMDI